MRIPSIIILSAWAAFWIYWLISSLGAKPDAKTESGVSRGVQLVLSAATYAFLFPGLWRWSPLLSMRVYRETRTLFFAGMALVGLGLAFAVWARVHLGAYWSGRVTIKEDHRLIRSGPYRWVRNPIYTGLAVAIIGTALTQGRFHGAVAVVLFIGATVYKIRKEERFLLAQFGDEFRDYARKVKSLVPFVL